MSKNLKLVTLDALKYFKDKIEPTQELTGKTIEIKNAAEGNILKLILKGEIMERLEQPSLNHPVNPIFLENCGIQISRRNLMNPKFITNTPNNIYAYRKKSNSERGFLLEKNITYVLLVSSNLAPNGLYINDYETGNTIKKVYDKKELVYTPEKDEKVSFDAYWNPDKAPKPLNSELGIFIVSQTNFYEPFQGIFTEDFPVLRALPDGTKDEFDVNTGKIIRKVGELQLTKQNNIHWSTWGANKATPGLIGFYSHDIQKQRPYSEDNPSVVSNYGLGVPYNWGGANEGITINTGDYGYLIWTIKNSDLEDVSSNEKAIESLNKKILLAENQNNPVTFWYKLETPKIEYYPKKAIFLNQGYNIITSDGLIDFSYCKDNSFGKIISYFNDIFFKKSGGRITGLIQLTKNVHYGKPAPITGEEGEIFFEDFNGVFDEDISAPSFIENGIPLSQKYVSEKQIPYQLSQLTADSLHQTVSNTEKQEWNTAIHIIKIWENASPRSDFTQQDIPFDWNLYDRALITFRRCSPILLESGGEDQGVIRESSAKIYRRYVEPSTSTIHFKDCYSYPVYGDSKNNPIRNDLCTPLTIYGVRGIK